MQDNKGPFTIRAAEEEAQRIERQRPHSYWRPQYHIAPRTGWLNDPNGLIFHQGVYHVFYQHYPYAPAWGPMHWGHATSRDLAHWEHLPVALVPDAQYGQAFSGSAVSDDEAIVLIYTGHRDDRSPVEVQCIASSKDGIAFEPYVGNPVVSIIPPDASEDFRDPKVWREQDAWYMVLGSGKSGRGKALLYRSSDLATWEYQGVLCRADPGQGTMWECPSFFFLGDKHCLMVSPMYPEEDGGNVPKNGKCLYLLGDRRDGMLAQEASQIVDYGSDYYAPQIFYGTGDRVLAMGWMDMWGKEMPTARDGWYGVLTLPRELRLRNGRVHAYPAPELQALRREKQFAKQVTLMPGDSNPLDIIRGDSLEIQLCLFLQPECTGFSMGLRTTPDGAQRTLLRYDRMSGGLSLDKGSAGAANHAPTVVDIALLPGEELRLHLFVDRSSLELFVNDGHTVLSERIYPDETALGYDLCCFGGGLRLRGEAWELGSAW